MLGSIDIQQNRALIMSGPSSVPQAPKNMMFNKNNRQIPYNNMMKKLSKKQDVENSTVLQSNSYSISIGHDASPNRFNDTSKNSHPAFTTAKFANNFMSHTPHDIVESSTPNQFDDTVSKIQPKPSKDLPQNIITFKRVKSRISKGRIYSAARRDPIGNHLDIGPDGASKKTKTKISINRIKNLSKKPNLSISNQNIMTNKRKTLKLMNVEPYQHTLPIRSNSRDLGTSTRKFAQVSIDYNLES